MLKSTKMLLIGVKAAVLCVETPQVLLSDYLGQVKQPTSQMDFLQSFFLTVYLLFKKNSKFWKLGK